VLRRHHYPVVRATLADPALAVVVKLAGPAAPLACPFERTAAILRLVREQTTVPVPEVLAWDTAYGEWPWRYLIMGALPGVRWNVACRQWTPEAQRDAWAQLGDAVAVLHTLRFPACGEIGADGVVVAGEDYPAALAARARRRIADPGHAAHFLAVLEARAGLFAGAAAPCLSHEGLNPNNILFAQDTHSGRWHLSGLLDFDSAWAGSPESDLARLALWDGMTGNDFWVSYGLTRIMTPEEEERRLVLQLLWCLEYARPTPRHHADTGRVCAALGLSPITFG
jgi:aminoglycoside phosphotransferase (APT) family kinase protein